jgi:hypothetical protein
VVPAMLDGKYSELDCRSMREMVSFSAVQSRNAVTAAEEVLADHEPATDDVRSLVAAARLAFDANPGRFTADAIVARIAQAAGDSARYEEEVTVASVDDRAAGAALYDLIEKIKGDTR